jgi:hypothetical protein
MTPEPGQGLVEPAGTRQTAMPRPAAAPVDELAPGAQVGRFVVEHKVGEGGMGSVYAAHDPVLDQRVAIKVIRADACTPVARERFLQEAHLVSGLDHPNIVAVHSIGELDDRRPYLVMELLQGETLAARLAARRANPFETIEILIQVCAALKTAHDHGVIHRDLKPDNVFLTYRDGHVVAKLLDFGIAKLVHGRIGGPALTRTGIMIGTPDYVSPEQARGRQVDHCTDIYSLGVIAYEMFLEDVPFAAESAAEVIAMHLHDDPDPPSNLWPDIPRELERLLLALLDKTATKRPTLAAVVATLERVRDHLARRSGASANARKLRPRTRFAEASEGPLRQSQLLALQLGNTLSTSAAHDLHALDRTGRRAGLRSRRNRLVISAAVAVLLAPAIIAVTIAARAGHEREANAGTLSAPMTDLHAAGETPDPIAVATATLAPAPSEPAIVAAPWPSLTIRASVKNARITIDGTVVAERARSVQRHIAPGLHRIVVTAPGHSRHEQTIELDSTNLIVQVALADAPRPRATAARDQGPPTSTSRRRSKLSFDPDGIIDPFERRR